MTYFSRLTDIVTCNLSQLLDQAEDPRRAIVEIIREMQEGVRGAQRSADTASASEQRLREEIESHQSQVELWTGKAKEQLQSGSENDARQSLLRKREVEDLIAGLSQQHKAAIAMQTHLATMQRALQARLSEALRRQESLGGSAEEASDEIPLHLREPQRPVNDFENDIDAELEQLKRQLQS